MLSLLIICLIAGGIGAVLQGMIGIGTGLIIVPLLTFLLPHYGIPQNIAVHIAVATSMAAIVVSSISALITHHQRGNVQWPIFKKIILFSITGAGIGAILASSVSGKYLQWFFGGFMLFMAIYMLVKKTAANLSETIPNLSLPKMAAGGFSIGFFASVIGAGGNVFMIPFLHSLNVNIRYAIGTSTLIGIPVAIVGTLTYIVVGFSQTVSTDMTFGYLHWPAFLAISLAGLLCAPLGAKLTAIVPVKILQRVFAVGVAIVGIKMLGIL